MIERPDLRTAESPANLEVYQLTDEALPSCHIYMEAQVFAPDSRRFLVHRSAHPHGSDPLDPEHRYLLCDLDAGGSLAPVTEELGATAPSVTPDGQWLYYFVNETRVGEGRLILKRCGLDGAGRETVMALDGPLPGTDLRVSRPYPLSSISSDGQRLALSCFLGDGQRENAPWGLMVFDLVAASVELIFQGPTWCNVHPQYSRSTDAAARRDILIQENHGNRCDAQGVFTALTGGAGADIHVIADDGTNLRDLPWGRDDNEFCQGHQCWIGRTERALTSTSKREPPCAELIEGRAVPHQGHMGNAIEGAHRNDLSRLHPQPDFYHFATDIAGRRLITDGGPKDGAGGDLWVADIPASDTGALDNWTWLMSPGSSWDKGSHIHPFLSPDGRTGFFNSDESGTLQAYMVRGWD